MVATVKENMKGFTPRQIKEAEEARRLLYNVGCPSVADFKKLLQMNTIKNCPVTQKHVDRAEKIFHPDVGLLKGKSTRSKPAPVARDDIQIPQELVATNYLLYLCVDVLYVNGIGFLVTIDKQIKYHHS